eukprot:10875726-Prorocentrum_lima.AAC.1
MTVHEKKLGPVEKAKKGEAVTKALRARIDNEALQRVKKTEVDPRNVCPTRMLSKRSQAPDG